MPTDYTIDANCKGAWCMSYDNTTEQDVSSNNEDLTLDTTGGGSLHTSTDVPSGFSGTSRLFVQDYTDSTPDFMGNLSHNDGGSTDITGTALSIVAWIKPTALSGSPAIAGKSDGSSEKQYLFGYSVSTQGIYFTIYSFGGAGNDTISSGTNTVPLNQWSHVAGVYNGTDIRTYVNGVLIGTPVSCTRTLENKTSKFRIGTILAAASGEFSLLYEGYMMDVAIFNRALTAVEVSDIFINGLGGDCSHRQSQTGSSSGEEGGGCFSGLIAVNSMNLAHLEGETVGILADGEVLDQQVVSDASVNVSTQYGEIHIGLPYASDLETLDIELQSKEGTLQGSKIKVGSVTYRFVNSRGGYIGADVDSLYEAFDDTKISQNVTQLEFEDDSSVTFNQASALYTGDIRVPLGAGFSHGGRMFFRQIDPLPVTISAIVPEISGGKATG